MYKKHFDIDGFLKTSDRMVFVEVETVHGSTPRDSGTWMIVSREKIFRTIGGGQLENIAIEEARKLIDSTDADPKKMQIPLGPHIGQCCGGTVNLHISILNEIGLQVCRKLVDAEIRQLPNVYIFGAGHVGNALADAMALLPVKPILIDSRQAELNAVTSDIETRLSAMPESEVRSAKAGSAFVIFTHDHTLDFLITQAALDRQDAVYVGMIGSKTKRATFRNWLRRENGSDEKIEKLVCPIGNTATSDKRPEVIAAFVAAEIIDQLNKASNDVLQVDQPMNIRKKVNKNR